jgi:hypothetical protein
MNLVSEVMSAGSLRIQVFLDVMLCHCAQYNIQEDLNHLCLLSISLLFRTVLRLVSFSTCSCFASFDQTVSFWKDFILCGKYLSGTSLCQIIIIMHSMDPEHRQSDSRMWDQSYKYKIYKTKYYKYFTNSIQKLCYIHYMKLITRLLVVNNIRNLSKDEDCVCTYVSSYYSFTLGL